MSRRRYSMKRGDDNEHSSPKTIISGPGAMVVGVGRHQHLEAQDRIERHVEQQAGQHGGDRRRTFRMRIGQPGVQRHQTDFGAVADEQEDEGEVEQLRAELGAPGPSGRSTSCAACRRP